MFLCDKHSCDGKMHYTAIWDEDTQKSEPVDYRCPLADTRPRADREDA